jgi:hypothetical protein
MSRPPTLEWCFKREMERLIAWKRIAIAKRAGVSETQISEVILRKRPANEAVVRAICEAAGGLAREALFFRRPAGRDATGSMRVVTDWRLHADMLRRALREAGERSAAGVDVDFIGTDGTFLRALLAETEGDTSVSLPGPYRIRLLRMSLVSIRTLGVLKRLGLVTAADVRVADEFRRLLRRRREFGRADGGTTRVRVVWRNRLPARCATRVDRSLVFGHTGINERSERLWVHNVRVAEEGDPEFANVTEWLDRALGDGRTPSRAWPQRRREHSTADQPE